jgi:hypothetical protein
MLCALEIDGFETMLLGVGFMGLHVCLHGPCPQKFAAIAAQVGGESGQARNECASWSIGR